ncbi:MAG: extracellular solute-binding protein [Hyphomicrobiaceae bacterium]|nr:extracellular solute-binding protein [Hyphomicrobiaceae bacterium]
MIRLLPFASLVAAVLIAGIAAGSATDAPAAPPPEANARQQAIAPHATPVHAIAMHGAPRYPATMQAFPYVDRAAPKGGSVRIGVLGTFDSLNPLIIKGVSAAGLRDHVYETLMTRGLDEPFTLYPGLAATIEVPADRSSITFHLDPDARFSDGHPVDVEDVLFSLAVLRDHGRPNHRAYYKKIVRSERLGPLSVRFDLEPGDRELPLILGLMPVLPAHLMTAESFQQTTLQAPVGSGPYRVGAIDAGRSITYVRDPAWWARERPVNLGRYNFDEVRFDYFRDDAAMFEAFKAGTIDLRPEEDPARWAEGYDTSAVRDGRIRKGEFEIGLPAGLTALVFNTRRSVFADQRVRQALILLFDSAFINKSLYHGLYTRSRSVFERSVLSSAGRAADAAERAMLAPFAGAVRPAILEGTHDFPSGDGTGRNRDNQRAALALLTAAGYDLSGGRLVERASRQPLAFEMLAVSAAQERLYLAYARDLEKVGIAARIRLVDAAQFQSRLKTFDFDMIQWRWPSSLSPGNEQLFRWSSDAAGREGSFNFPGVASPAVDAMIGHMLRAEDEPTFISAVRALDRVLLSGDYVLPLFHIERQWVAYWTHLGHPARDSLFGYQLDTWWSRKAGAESKASAGAEGSAHPTEPDRP